MKTMTRDQAFDALRDAVNERGRSFVYNTINGCMNVNSKGEPDCLVGLALWRFGEQNDLPENFMLNYRYGTIIGVANRLREDGVLSIGKSALVVLKVAQRFQDEGKSWGEAFDAAVITADALALAGL